MGARCNVYLPIAGRFMMEENTPCDKPEYEKIKMQRNSLKGIASSYNQVDDEPIFNEL